MKNIVSFETCPTLQLSSIMQMPVPLIQIHTSRTYSVTRLFNKRWRLVNHELAEYMCHLLCIMYVVPEEKSTWTNVARHENKKEMHCSKYNAHLSYFKAAERRFTAVQQYYMQIVFMKGSSILPLAFTMAMDLIIGHQSVCLGRLQGRLYFSSFTTSTRALNEC